MEKLTRNELFKYVELLKRKVWELNDEDFRKLCGFQNRYNEERGLLK